MYTVIWQKIIVAIPMNKKILFNVKKISLSVKSKGKFAKTAVIQARPDELSNLGCVSKRVFKG